jgi:hypothetical protein
MCLFRLFCYSKGICVRTHEKKLFVSMDVIFREPEPYLPSRVDPSFGDSPNDGEIRREGEKCAGDRSIQLEAVSAPVLRQKTAEGDESEEKEENMVTEGETNCAKGS